MRKLKFWKMNHAGKGIKVFWSLALIAAIVLSAFISVTEAAATPGLNGNFTNPSTVYFKTGQSIDLTIQASDPGHGISFASIWWGNWPNVTVRQLLVQWPEPTTGTLTRTYSWTPPSGYNQFLLTMTANSLNTTTEPRGCNGALASGGWPNSYEFTTLWGTTAHPGEGNGYVKDCGPNDYIYVVRDDTAPSTSASVSPSSGWAQSKTATATASDSGSGVQYVYCRLEGEGSWTRGSAGGGSCSRTATANTTFYYYAVDKVGNQSSTKTVSITNIDRTAPTLGFAGANTTTWYNSNRTITPNSSDSGGSGLDVQYVSTYNGGWKSSINVSVTSDIYCYAKDKAGNENSGFCGTVHIDKTPPELGFAGAQEGVWYNTPRTISPNSSDSGGSGLDVQYVSTYNGGWKSSINVSVTSDIYCYAKDKAGNENSGKCGRVNVDSSAPIPGFIASGTKGNDNWFLSNVTVTANSSDPESGLIINLVSTSENGTYNNSIVVTSSTEIWCHAINTANVEVKERCGNVKIDKDNPVPKATVTGGTTGENGWYTSEITVSNTGTDATSGISANLVSLNGTNWSSSVKISSTGESGQVVYFRSVDYAGREATIQQTYKVDPNPPIPSYNVTSGTSGDNGWYTTDVTIEPAGYDGISGVAVNEIKVGSDDWTDQPLTLTGEGTHTIYYRTTDNAGLTAQKSATIKIDKTAPTNVAQATVQQGAQDNVWQGSVKAPVFNFEGADDAVSGVNSLVYYWGMDAEGFCSTTSPSTTGLSGVEADESGIYFLKVRVVDNAGLSSDCRTVFTFKYDKDAPVFDGEAVESHGVISGEWQKDVIAPAFSWTPAADEHSGLAGYQIYWGTDPMGVGDTFAEAPEYAPLPVSESGTYYLRVRAVDNTGNGSDWMTLYEFRYDVLPPQLPKVLETSGAVNDIWQNHITSPVFQWDTNTDTHVGLAGHYVYWGTDANGEADEYITDSSYQPAEVTEPGIYFLRMKAVDALGNQSSWQTVFIFKYTDQQTNSCEIDGSTECTIVSTGLPGTIHFPVGAVDELTRIYYSEIDAAIHPVPQGKVALAYFTLIGKRGANDVYNFNQPYQMTFSYSNKDVIGLAEESLEVAIWNEDAGEWQSLMGCEGCSVDTENNTITVYADHFTDFAIFAVESDVAMGMVEVYSGPLSWDTPSFQFPDVTLNGFSQVVDASVEWTVRDATGTGAGWYTTIQAEDFVSERGSISASGFMVALDNDAIVKVMGNEEPFSMIAGFHPIDDVVTIMAAQPMTGMGTYTFSPEFQLFIPASASAGTYTSEITVTVIPGIP